MSKKVKIIILLLTIILLLIAIYWLIKSGLFEGPFVKEIPSLKVGVVLPLGSTALPQGEALSRAAALAATEINSVGGAAGREFQLISRDGACEQNKSRRAAEELITRQGVKFILGGFCESETLALATAAEPGRVLLLTFSSGNSSITGGGDFVFNFMPKDQAVAILAARYARESSRARRAVVLSENRRPQIALADVFAQNFQTAGGEVVYQRNFHPRRPNFQQIADELSGLNFDLLYIQTSISAFASKFLEQLAGQEHAPTVLLPAAVLSGSSLAEYANLEGTITLLPYFDNRSKQRFIDNYQESYGESPAYPREQAAIYSAVYLLSEAVDKYGLDLSSIKNYFAKLKNKPSVLGDLTFDEHGNLLYSYRVVKVQEGKLVELQNYK